MATTQTTEKTATATKASGQNVYGVTYPGHADCDSGVPYRYLEKLARDGYAVTVQGDDIATHTIWPTVER